MPKGFGGVGPTEKGMCRSGDREEQSRGRQQGVKKGPVTCRMGPDSTLYRQQLCTERKVPISFFLRKSHIALQ